MRFELNHLKYFYYTVTEGGVTKAAKSLHVQQPVVSKMIKILEEDLGKELFITIGRKKELTDFGQKVFRHCDLLFAQASLIENLESKKNSLPKALSIGGAEHLLNYLCTSKTVNLYKKFPETNFVLNVNSFSEMKNNLINGHLDFGICLYLPKEAEGIEVIRELPVQHHLVVAKSYLRDKVTMNSFIGSREVDDRKTKRFPTLTFHRRKWPECTIKHSSNSFSIHKSLVEQGRGIAILPKFLIDKELTSGKFVDIYPKELFEWRLKVLVKKETPIPDYIGSLFV